MIFFLDLFDPYRLPAQVPDGLTVLMSASRSSYSKLDRIFQFSMEFPVPSYLVALVAGELQHVDIGPRSVGHLDKPENSDRLMGRSEKLNNPVSD